MSEPTGCIQCGDGMPLPAVIHTAFPGWTRIVSRKSGKPEIILICPECRGTVKS